MCCFNFDFLFEFFLKIIISSSSVVVVAVMICVSSFIQVKLFASARSLTSQ